MTLSFSSVKRDNRKNYHTCAMTCDPNKASHTKMGEGLTMAHRL